MKVERTTNRGIIKKVLCDPEIFPLIVGNAPVTPETFDPPMRQAAYFAGYEDGKLIGLVGVHSFWDGVKYHPNVLPDKRKYANQFIRETIKVLNRPLYIEIPERLENLAIHHGFEEICRDDKILMRLL